MTNSNPTQVITDIQLAVIELQQDTRKNLNNNNIVKNGDISKAELLRRNISISEIITCGLAELVGTALLLFLGCGACVEFTPIPHHFPSLAFGLVIMLIIQCFGHISGSHLNPAVTIAAVLLKVVKPIMGIVYIIAQFVGAFVGFGLLKILLPAEVTSTEVYNAALNVTEHKVGLCTTMINPKTSLMQGLALETILTFVLVMVCCSVWDKRNHQYLDSLPLRFGLIVTALAIVGGPYTGPSLNTVRSFSPAFFNNDWSAHWVYWVGPNMGAVIAVFFYKTVFAQAEEKEQIDTPENIPLNEKSNCDISNNI